MMPVINGILLAISSSPAASIVAKATVAAALGLLASSLARGSRAAVRHTLLAAAFAVMLLLPVVSFVVPAIRIAIPSADRPQQAVPVIATAPGATSTAAPAVASAADALPAAGGLSPSALLLAAWLAGMALSLAPVVMGLRQVRSLRRTSLPWPEAQPLFAGLANDAGIHRRVEVMLHEAASGPMTCGILHPAIVLSPDARNWAPDDLNRALVHELEHVRRGDWLIHCLARTICSVYWFHPLVWAAWRRLVLEAERSCDDAVLGRSEATAYAEQLVGLARRLSTKTPLLAMANRADLTARVGAVLDSRQRRGRAGALAIALACAAAAALILTISPLRMVAAQQSAAADTAASPIARFMVNSGLVIEDVTVTGPDGKAVEGLKAGDFTITEDGDPQRIALVEFRKLAAPPRGKEDPTASYYILGYYPKNQDVDGLFRRIKIAEKGDANVKLTYRPGYYADKSWKSITGASPAAARSVVELKAIPGVAPPQLITKVIPAYADEARKARYQGRIVLTVEVDASGQVASAKPNRSLGLGLDEKAIEAVKQWRFRPAIKDGKPVATQVEVEADFRLL